MKRNLRLLLWLNYGLIYAVILGFIWLAFKINKHNEDQEMINKNILQTFSQSENPLKALINDTSKKIILQNHDISEINSHIQFLTEKVITEVARTQQNSQYDIDRINTFITFGIGILAVIGGLLPIFFNSSLKESIRELETDTTILTKLADSANTTAITASTNSNSALTTANKLTISLAETQTEMGTLNSSVTRLSVQVSNTEKMTPSVNTLILQSSVSRFLNIGVTRLKDPKRTAFLSNVFEGLIKAFENFRNFNFTLFNDMQKKIFKDSIEDLRLGVGNLLISTAVESKVDYNFLKDLYQVVVKFQTEKESDFDKSLQLICTEIEKIKSGL